VAENLRLVRAYLREHLCTDCGEPDIVVLEFDHLRDKTAAVSALVHQGVSWERVLEEIAKCEVVCANCHRRRTARRAGHHSWIADEFEELAQL
jgi:5-methylcytosine-specific restriction endonuclease McrA